MGRAIASIQVGAAHKAYKEEFQHGKRSFIRSVCTELPHEIGESAAHLRIDGARSAMVGLCWRLPLIGGSAFVGALYFGFGLGVAAIALTASIPVCCVLVLA